MKADLIDARVWALCLGVASLAPAPASAQNQLPSQQQGTVTGFVYDSVGRAPLSGADVQLVRSDGSGSGRSYVATTDSRGMYEVRDVEPGAYLAGFFHPAADSLGLTPGGRQILVREGVNRVDLALPSPATVVARLCDGTRLTDSTALLVGFVRDAEQLTPRREASVILSWNEFAVSEEGLFQFSPQVEINAPNGWFALCEAPAGVRILLRAAAGSDSSGFVEAEFPSRQIVRRDFYVGGGWAVDQADQSLVEGAIRGVVRRGDAVLTGRVVSAAGRPVPRAVVTVKGSASLIAADDSGRFALRNLPAGTHMVEARAIGFVPGVETVHLLDGVPNAAQLTLTRVRDYLDTVRVTASRVLSRDRTGFERRQRSGIGHYLDRNRIERRRAMTATELLRSVPGVTVRWTEGVGFEPLMVSPFLRSGYCRPALFVNGVRLNIEAADVDALAPPDQIDGIEVYTRASSLPVEFATQNGCGSIVIWTGPPRPSPPRVRQGS